MQRFACSPEQLKASSIHNAVDHRNYVDSKAVLAESLELKLQLILDTIQPLSDKLQKLLYIIAL